MRTTDRPSWTDVLTVAIAIAITGVAYGATAQDAGFPLWLTLTIAIGTTSASAELLFLSIVASGGAPLLAAAAGVLVGLRNGVYGAAVSPVLSGRFQRVLGAHLANDETAAYAAAVDPANRRDAYWRMGLGVLVGWALGTAAGAILGEHVLDAHAIGLDAAFPALLAAILLSLARDVRGRAVAGIGAVVAAVAAPIVAAGVAPVLALAGLAALVPGGRPTRRVRA